MCKYVKNHLLLPIILFAHIDMMLPVCGEKATVYCLDSIMRISPGVTPIPSERLTLCTVGEKGTPEISAGATQHLSPKWHDGLRPIHHSMQAHN